MPRTVFAFLLLPLLLLAVLASGADAQRAARVLDSTSVRCLAGPEFDARAVCEGRFLNAVSTAIIGTAIGMGTGGVGGLLVPSRCIGDSDRASTRGAIVGAGVGFLGGLLAKHVSRRERATLDSARRAAALRSPPRPWSWRDVKPAVTTFGVIAAGGAAIGAAQGARSPSPCDGIGQGIATGAAVYGAGGAGIVVGSLLVVRFLF